MPERKGEINVGSREPLFPKNRTYKYNLVGCVWACNGAMHFRGKVILLEMNERLQVFLYDNLQKPALLNKDFGSR